LRILIWQTAYPGDVVLSTPLILSLRESFPSAHLAFVGRPFISELLRGSGVELIPFSKGFLESFKIRERIRGYDIVISPHRSARSALILYFSGIPVRVGFSNAELSFLYTHRVEHRWGVHEVERNLSLLEPLGAKKLVRKTKLWLKEEEREEILSRFSLLGRTYVVFAPFSNFPLKEWSPKNWAKLIDGIGLEVVLVGTQKDKEKAQEIRSLSRRGFLDLTGRTTLRELMGIIAGARFVVANDSAPVHIANALGVGALSVYTATSPLYGFYPLFGGYVENPSPCSPCSPNPKRCKTGTRECVSVPSPEDVLGALEKFLGADALGA